MNWNLIFGILIISSPILFSMIAFPDYIAWSWNEGRGSYFFALVFVVAELIGLKIIISKKRLLAVVPMALLTIAYLISLEYGLRDYLIASAEQFDVQLIYSWTWMWDFFVMAIFVVAALTVFFGKRWIRIAPAGPIFLTGTAIILSLDAFFPYDTLGPLQYIVPYFVQANVWVITALDLGTAVARDNVMFLRGDHGSMALQVFWPSAGVHSIIIFSLVIGAFMLKMNIPRGRKIVYFVLGIIGTITVNLIRIFSLSWYALKVTTDAAAWEEYHQIAGEIMFLPWLFAFIFIVILIESRRLKKKELGKNNTTKKYPVSLNGQSICVLFPVVNLWAAWRIEKLRLFLLINILMSIGIILLSVMMNLDEFLNEDLWPSNYGWLNVVFYASVSFTNIFLIRRWSLQWNRGISQTDQGNENDFFYKE